MSQPRSRRLAILPLEDRTVPAVVDLVSGTLSFTAAPGETNFLHAAVDSGRFRFEQAGGTPLTLSAKATAAGWTTDGVGKVSGPVAGVTAVDISLGDKDDSIGFDGFEASILRLTVDAGGGSDALTVGSRDIPSGTSDAPGSGILQTGVGVAGDVTFKNFSHGYVYKYITAGGVVSFTNAGSSVGQNLLVNRSINGSAVNVVGGSGDDSLAVNYRGPTGAELVLPKGINFDGGTGTNTLSIAGPTTGTHTFTADGTKVTRDGAMPINVTRVQKATLNGGPLADSFTVTPNTAMAIDVYGGDGDDTLTIQAGPSVAGLTATQSGSILHGSAAVTGMKSIGFDTVESVAPRPAVLIALTSPASSAAAGATLSYSIAVANPSTATLTNVAIADVLPAQFQNATWTSFATTGSSLTKTSGSGPVATTATLAGGGSVTIVVTVQVKPGTSGQMTTYRATATGGTTAMTGELNIPIRQTGRPSVKPTDLYAVGSGPGSQPLVKVFNRQGGAPRMSFLAYDAAFTGGVNVATADVTGDGVEDIITAPGTGGGPHVKVFDGVSGALVQQFMAYDPKFTGGVNVAAGYVTGDSRADIITGPGAGGGPHVKVFDGSNDTVAMQFMAYDPKFTGGVNVAAGDLSTPASIASMTFVAGTDVPQYSDGDGIDDIVTAPGAGGGPNVKVFSGADGRIVRDFMAYDAKFSGGVSVAAGDVDGDGRADLVTAPGIGGGPQIRVFSGAYDQIQGHWANDVRSFLAFDASGRTGYRVATVDIDQDGKADILTGTGPGVAGRVTARDGATDQERFVFGPFDPTAMGGVSLG
ncbi:MAG: hypothetical protein U0746_04485 [Gemmataceae bacterium]